MTILVLFDSGAIRSFVSLAFDKNFYVTLGYLDHPLVVFDEARLVLLDEAHKSKFLIHPSSTKMYRDLVHDYWWPYMKRDVDWYLERCLTCMNIKGQTSEFSWKILATGFLDV